MKSILMSIKPKHCANILNGLKTKEIRKFFPKDYRGWIYIYCTKDIKNYLYWDWYDPPYVKYEWFTSKNPKIWNEDRKNINGWFNGKVIARFYCDNVEEIKFNKSASLYYIDRHSEVNIGEVMLGEMSCLNHKQLDDYLQEENGYAINISNLEIFDTPKELSEFRHYKRFDCYNADFDYTTIEYRQIRLTKAPQNYCYIEE